MFPLYKYRNANGLIQDTFAFFRSHGKSYYGTYFKALGWILLLLVIFGFLIGKAFIETALLGSQAPQSAAMLETYFSSNMDYFVSLGILGGVVLLLLTVANYAYPVFYLDIIANTEKKADSRQILMLLKKNIGRILLFGLISLFVWIPMGAVVATLAVPLMFTVVGIPVAIAVFMALYSWGALTFYEYLTNRTGYFTAMGRGWNIYFSNTWGNLAATAVMIIIMYIVQGVVAVVPTLLGIGAFLADGGESGAEISEGILITLFILSSVLGFLTGHLLMVNQGLIYYSGREMKEHRGQKTEIDLIGRNFE